MQRGKLDPGHKVLMLVLEHLWSPYFMCQAVRYVLYLH